MPTDRELVFLEIGHPIELWRGDKVGLRRHLNVINQHCTIRIEANKAIVVGRIVANSHGQARPSLPLIESDTGLRAVVGVGKLIATVASLANLDAKA